MQPQELLEHLMNLQRAANNATVTSAAVSQAIGEYTEFLGDSSRSFADLPRYVTRLQRCISAHNTALEKYCESAAMMVGGMEQ